eukprot:3867084-Rhodomonas_salina.3
MVLRDPNSSNLVLLDSDIDPIPPPTVQRSHPDLAARYAPSVPRYAPSVPRYAPSVPRTAAYA